MFAILGKVNFKIYFLNMAYQCTKSQEYNKCSNKIFKTKICRFILNHTLNL